jgi:hypothetical protein
MGLGDQFTGLDMENLIGGPLSAAAKASLLLADGTAHFINSVGFDDNKKLRTVDFGYRKKTHNDDGSDSIDEMHIEAPLLSIVPIPNLQIDNVNIYFDMEVKESTQSESSKDMSASLSASGSIFGFKVSITGSISAHESNSRSTDNSAKYHVDVTATNHGTPEGLNRILDIIAANAAPALSNSSLVDKNGNALSGETKARADKLKQLQGKKDEKSRALAAAQKVYTTGYSTFARIAQNVESGFLSAIQQDIVKTDKDDAKLEKLHQAMDTIRSSWTNLVDTAKDVIAMAASESAKASAADPAAKKLTNYIKLLSYDTAKTDTSDYAVGDKDPIETAFEGAVSAYQNIDKAQDELDAVEKDINQLLSGNSQPSQPQPQQQSQLPAS